MHIAVPETMAFTPKEKSPNLFGNITDNLGQIYRSRNILYSLIRKNLFGSYRNSSLGFLWHFIMPVAMLVIYYVVFTGGIRSNPMDDFMVFLASGIFPFMFMTSNLAGGAGCVVSNGAMIKKMYFPREIFVLSQVISSFIIMLMGYAMVFVYILISGYPLDPIALLTLIPLLLMMLVFVTGYVLLFSSLTVYRRDIQYFLSSIRMLFFFGTPAYFVASETTGIFSKLIWFNPFTYFVENLHTIVYFGDIPALWMWVIPLGITLLSLTIGYAVFEKLKGGFAERL